jgi:hypothetical protein
LWTDFDCGELNADKARTYLERSKPSPIDVSLYEGCDLSLHGSFLQIIPHATDRLKSLGIEATQETLQDITAHLSRPAPLLEELFIDCGCKIMPHLNPTLTATLFNGDLSSLCSLTLKSVRTELPWRGMTNLTSFVLADTSPRDIPIGRFLDFFESAPHLRKIKLLVATPISGAQNGRLVSLVCLKWMEINGSEPPSFLLDHLIIPVGAKLQTEGTSRGPLIETLLPRSLDNLRNLPNFTNIRLLIHKCYTQVQFIGPNGGVCMVPETRRVDTTCLALESLARFDTSKTERLEINRGNSPSSDPPYQALLPMRDLRTLTLSHCTSPDIFIHALDPDTSPSGAVVCPKLEELVLVLRLDGETFDIKNVIEMAATRASRGAKLKSVRIVTHNESMQIDVLELRKHALHVECGPRVDVTDDDGDYFDEED